jgi:hypothetical protein
MLNAKPFSSMRFRYRGYRFQLSTLYHFSPQIAATAKYRLFVVILAERFLIFIITPRRSKGS